MMNFEEWFDFYYGKNPRISSDTVMDSQVAWEACKEEVLKILNNNKRDCLTNSNDWLEYVRISVINEIEKL